MAARYAGPDADEVEAQLLGRVADRGRRAVAGRRDLEEGRARLVADVDDALRRTIARDGEELEPLRRLAMRSAIVAPLRAHGASLGNVVLSTGPRRRSYEAADLGFAEAVARHLARAIDGARAGATMRELQALIDNMDDAVNVRDLDGRDRARPTRRLPRCCGLRVARRPARGRRFPRCSSASRCSTPTGARCATSTCRGSACCGARSTSDPLLMRRVIRETGEQQWLLNKATAIRDGGGRPVMVMSVTEDVTATQRAEIGRRLLLEAGRLLSRSLDGGGRRSRRSPSSSCRRSRTGAGSTCPAPAGVVEPVAVAHIDPDRVASGARAARAPPGADRRGVGPRRRAAHGRAAAGRRDHGRDAARGRRRTREQLELLRAHRPRLADRRAAAGRRRDPRRAAARRHAGRPALRRRRPGARGGARARGSARRCATRACSATATPIAHVLSAGLAPDPTPQVAGCEVAAATGRRARAWRRAATSTRWWTRPAGRDRR